MGSGASVNKNENTDTDQNLIFATYKLLPEYKFCCTHSCYANGGIIPENIPEPSPPSSRKSDIYDPADNAEINVKACQVTDRFMKQSIPKLVKFLTKDLNETLAKVRILFRWLTAQPLEHLSMETEPAHHLVEYQFWRIKNRKGNYAQLFSLLCSCAQIPCIIISGRLKGSSYNIGESVEDTKHYGEWNAVLIDGSWRLFNVFWGACTEGPNDDNGEKKLVYCCDDNYFLTDPDQFIYTHLPDEDRWQLLDTPISQEDFTHQALLKDRFFDMDLKLNYPHKCVVYCENEVSISFDMPSETQSNLWLLALLSHEDDEQRTDLKRYVFVERIDNHEMRIRVRNPGTGKYKLEIVGKDETRKGPDYSIDWVAIYKIISNTSGVSPFPECPLIGWGPGNRTMYQSGLTALSHNAGKIDTSTGSVEIKFEKSSNLKRKYKGDLIKSGELNPLLNNVVHRVEGDGVIFNVETPVSGEYALKIQATNEEGIVTNICNYFIDSSQNKTNNPFPSDLHDGLGAKEAMQEMGIDIVTPESAFVISDSKDTIFEFKKPSNVNLTAFVSSDDPSSLEWKLRQTIEEEKAVYKVKPLASGNYSFRLRAVVEEGALPQSVYDAVIKFTKVKKEKNAVSNEDNTLKELPEEIRSRIDKAVKNEDDKDLELIIQDIKSLPLSTKQQEIDNLHLEIEVIKCRKVLVSATISKKIPMMEAALKSTYGKACVSRLENEINTLKAMLERTKKIARLLRDVMELKQNVISEIKSYKKPPPVVHGVMIASLLLLGYNEDQTRNWPEVQKILGGTVRDSIIRKVSKFDIDRINPRVAQKAKSYISDITLDDVRLISAGAATFYSWVKGVTEEMDKRRSEGNLASPDLSDRNINEHSEGQLDSGGNMETFCDINGQTDHLKMKEDDFKRELDNKLLEDDIGKGQPEEKDNDRKYTREQENSNSTGQNETHDDIGDATYLIGELDFKEQSVTYDQDNNGNPKEGGNSNGENVTEENQSDMDYSYDKDSWEEEDTNGQDEICNNDKEYLLKEENIDSK